VHPQNFVLYFSQANHKRHYFYSPNKLKKLKLNYQHLLQKNNKPYFKTQTAYKRLSNTQSHFLRDIKECLGIPGMFHMHTYGGY
jgi:hypothetical protein